jgi:aryl-alcohol dehydrogenase-like predicted oxidoreductase
VRTRTLGRTGLRVPLISLGSWLTLGGSVGEDASVAIVRRAFELGVTLFDTANVYERGGAEEVLGRALAPLPREELVVATKVFGEMGPRPEDRGLGEHHVREQCDASLRRLGLDAIDLYQCNRYDPETPLEATCRVMDELVRAGKVRHWGVSEWTPAQMTEAVELCQRESLAPPETDQPRYSMLQREAERLVLPACERLRFGVLVFSPLAQGVLTGKYRTAGDLPEGSRASSPRGRGFVARFLTDEHLARVERLRAIAAEVGVPLAHLALAWAVRSPVVSTAIVGATSVEQLEQNVAAADVELDAATLDRIEAALAS